MYDGEDLPFVSLLKQSDSVTCSPVWNCLDIFRSHPVWNVWIGEIESAGIVWKSTYRRNPGWIRRVSALAVASFVREHAYRYLNYWFCSLKTSVQFVNEESYLLSALSYHSKNMWLNFHPYNSPSPFFRCFVLTLYRANSARNRQIEGHNDNIFSREHSYWPDTGWILSIGKFECAGVVRK